MRALHPVPLYWFPAEMLSWWLPRSQGPWWQRSVFAAEWRCLGVRIPWSCGSVTCSLWLLCASPSWSLLWFLNNNGFLITGVGYPCLYVDILYPGVIGIARNSLVIFMLRSLWWCWCPCSLFCRRRRGRHPSCWLYQNMVDVILLSAVVVAELAEKKWLFWFLGGHTHADTWGLDMGAQNWSTTLSKGGRACDDGNGQGSVPSA